ncbi:NACHT ankyrin domain-containing protein [Fusarium globosum]|uniref:NACHT ankyrin domain-containing protein n=1 Tax=Fusarium globosum TaxID=78864 RepID=A0A8H5UMQ1_9HYPO|nr:NACHT ankyrin domain-containing protein [Fusarium globosum]
MPSEPVPDFLGRVTIDMLGSFPNIILCLMVATGGAVPRPDHDMRLGDVVVSTGGSNRPGIVQFDFGKTVGGTVQVERDSAIHPPQLSVLNAVASLAVDHEINGNHIDEGIEDILDRNPRLRVRYQRPSPSTDRLFKPDATHDICCNEDGCSSDPSNYILRHDRRPAGDIPKIHYGTIGLGNSILKNAIARDRLATEDRDILCLAAGTGPGIIRPFHLVCGICNYCDSHKSREWQPYAAMAAAVYTRDLLLRILPQSIENQGRLADIMTETNLIEDKMLAIRHAVASGADVEGENSAGAPTDDKPSSKWISHSVTSETDMTAPKSSISLHEMAQSGSRHDFDNGSTVPTSVDMGEQGKSQDTTDNTSIYTSDIPESSKYMYDLAASFFEPSQIPESDSLERILKSLPDILRGFALRIGGEQETLGHFEIMKFLHQKRKDISQEFERYYLRDSDNIEQKSDAMPFGDKVASWQIEDAESCEEDPNPEPYVDDPVINDDINIDTSHFEPSKYHGLVKKSTAFQWFISRLHREANMTASDASSMKTISTKIRDALYARTENRTISRLKGPPRCSMKYESDWKPLLFFTKEEYTEIAEDALAGSIVLVQDGNNVQEALTCSDYVTRTWKFLGEDFLHLTKHVLRSNLGSKCSGLNVPHPKTGHPHRLATLH